MYINIYVSPTWLSNKTVYMFTYEANVAKC